MVCCKRVCRIKQICDLHPDANIHGKFSLQWITLEATTQQDFLASLRAAFAMDERSKYARAWPPVQRVCLTGDQCDNTRPSCSLCVKHNEVCVTLEVDENPTFSRQCVIFSKEMCLSLPLALIFWQIYSRSGAGGQNS